MFNFRKKDENLFTGSAGALPSPLSFSWTYRNIRFPTQLIRTIFKNTKNNNNNKNKT